MPTAILSRSLLFLFGTMTGLEASAFDCTPWTERVWRNCFGLATLKNPAEVEDEFIDIESDIGSQQAARAGDGFVLSSAALATVSKKRLAQLTDGRTIIQAETFMNKFWALWRKDADRGKPIEYTVDSLPPANSESKSAILVGYPEYKDLVLGMLNRRGGVMDTVAAVMAEFRVTPLERWKDDRHTNRRRKGRLQVEEYDVPLPSASTAVGSSTVLAAVGRRLFGRDVVSSGNVLLPEWEKTVTTLVMRKHESLSRKLKTRRDKSKTLYAEVDRCIQVACEARTAPALREASDALVEWRRIAIQTLEADDPPFLDQEKKLQNLWSELGFEVEEVATRKARRGVGTKSKPKGALPTNAAMEMAFEYYVQDYCHGIAAIDDLPIPSIQPLVGVCDITDGEIDIGVQHLKDWPTERLWESFGLSGKRQFPFAEPGTKRTDLLKLAEKLPAIPLWHQVVAAHAILEGGFTAEIGQRSRPTLLCDEVGLGKTFEIIGVISMVSHLYEQQMLDESKRLPPPPFTIANHTPYFNGQERIENLPSLVIAPRALTDQWVQQWHKFTQHGSFLIIRYSVGQGPLETFSSSPDGMYRRAAGPNLERASKVVIVADYSAILKEAQRCFEPPTEFYQGQEAQLHEARGDVANFWPGMDMEGSLFSMRFRVTAVDEIHNFRNCGVTNRGVQCLTENSQLVIGATATPLFTTFFDIAAEARVLRLQSMIGDQGVAHCKAMIRSTKARSTEWYANAPAIIDRASLQEAQQEAKEAGLSTEDAQFSDLVDQAKHKYGSEDQVSILKAAYITQGAIDLLRQVTRPVIIRRTGESRDYKGDRVLQKTPMRTIIAYSPMSGKERDGLAAVNEQQQEQRKAQEVNKSNKKVKKLDSAKIKWKRSACVHVDLVPVRQLERAQDKKEGSLFHTITDGWNESNIHEKASTRMLKVDQIIEHYWTGNPKPLVFKEDGTTITSAPGPDPLPCDDLRKFLIYVGFIDHRNLFGMMFEIKKRGYIYYDGSMLPSKRQEAVDKYNTDKDCRIMVISNVGATGLNLTAGSVVVLVSNVWSGQEKNQIVGRVHRFGQVRDVVVYDIVAPDGIDLALSGYADSKTCLSNRFLMSQKKLKQAYLEVTSKVDEDEDEDDDEEDDMGITQGATKATKVVSRKRKHQVTDGNEEEDDVSEDAAGKKKSGSARSSKRPKASSTRKTTSRNTGSTTKGKPKASSSRRKNTTAAGYFRPVSRTTAKPQEQVVSEAPKQMASGSSMVHPDPLSSGPGLLQAKTPAKPRPKPRAPPVVPEQSVSGVDGSLRLQDCPPSSTGMSRPKEMARPQPKPTGARQEVPQHPAPPTMVNSAATRISGTQEVGGKRPKLPTTAEQQPATALIPTTPSGSNSFEVSEQSKQLNRPATQKRTGFVKRTKPGAPRTGIQSTSQPGNEQPADAPSVGAPNVGTGPKKVVRLPAAVTSRNGEVLNQG
ncbi:hypothetical protein FRC11_005332 [Ceratobasidium sp. 423]|nr:hypothetical protein FRC11_005332 [Ceratobasidium sp. 423]